METRRHRKLANKKILHSVGPKEVLHYKTTFPQSYIPQQGFTEILKAAEGKNVKIEAENGGSLLMNIIVPLIPWLLIFGFIWFFVFRQLRNSAGAGGMLGNFGKGRARINSKEHTHVTFDDVAGIGRPRRGMEIVEFLRPEEVPRFGGRIPRGVLLVGEPGTGKTLLAKPSRARRTCRFLDLGSDFVGCSSAWALALPDLFKSEGNSPASSSWTKLTRSAVPRSGSAAAGTTSASDAQRHPVEMDGSTPTTGDRLRRHQPGGRAGPRPDPPRPLRRQIAVPLPT